MKVLIVEDSPPMSKMIRRAIAAWADEFCECASGGDALRFYAAELPDLVLMDIELGAVNGISATRQIKYYYPRAQIIMVTNYNDGELRQAAFRAGACGYVLKENLPEIGEWFRNIRT